MAKIRVFELASKLKMTSIQLLSLLREMNISVTSHMSGLNEEEVALVTNRVRKKITPVVATAKEATPKAAKATPKALKAPPKVAKAPPKEAPPIKAKEKPVPPPVEEVEPLKKRARVKKRPIIKVDEVITVDELARALKMKTSELIMELMKNNILATKNQPLEIEVARAIASQHGFDLLVTTSLEELFEEEIEEEEEKGHLEPRAPVVVVMGHVDHGKTTLLDVIRKSTVAEQEVGGITQHIGAYDIELPHGKVVFLDTPGHEAFTAMRARGAQVTDIVVLVVAADDGVKPQTLEAIDHARAAGVPIVVAINKIDKANANVEKVKRQLTEVGLMPEEWGGKTIVVPISAVTKERLNDLLEMLLLEAELLELKANPKKRAMGTVLEAKLDKRKGPVATVLVQNGTLHVGDYFVAGLSHGRVRALVNDIGEQIKSAPPATPVEVLGFSGVPSAGDPFIVVEDERKARLISESRQLKQREKGRLPAQRLTLEGLYQQILEGRVKELKIILKADVQGSLEALIPALEKLSTDEVKLRVIHSGVGGVNESDVLLASASDALLICFHVTSDPKAKEAIEREKVSYRYYGVIYELLDDVKAAMEGLLEPIYREVITGRAEVREIFKIKGVPAIGGSYVLEGEISRNQPARLIRDNVVLYEGKIASLKRFKEDVRSVSSGYECGLILENFDDIQKNDIVEALKKEEVERKL